MRVIAVDYPGYEPWDLEVETARDMGADFILVSYDEFRDQPRECDAIINGGCWPFPAELLDCIGDCRFILSFGTGLDWIDLSVASERGITVRTLPWPTWTPSRHTRWHSSWPASDA